MPDPTQTPDVNPDAKKPEPIKPFVFDATAFDAKVAVLQDAMNKVAGKPNNNPFKWAADTGLTDAIRQYKLGTKSKEIFDLVMSLQPSIPVIDPNWKEPEPFKPVLPKALQPPTGQR